MHLWVGQDGAKLQYLHMSAESKQRNEKQNEVKNYVIIAVLCLFFSFLTLSPVQAARQ